MLDITKPTAAGADISEDQEKDARDQIQKLTDEHVKKIDELLEAKEREVMEV